MVGSTVFGPDPVEAVLKRRGWSIEARGNKRDILLPLESDPPLSGQQYNEFLQLFAKSSFRKLARRITSGGGQSTMAQLAEIAGSQADQYVDFLVSLGVAQRSYNEMNLTRKIDNIGPTLEWYVAHVCQREFEGSAEWSVKLSDFRYGDCDVLAWLPPNVIYIETKSSEASQVTDSELKHFLQRGVDLAPELAILLVDTDDDLEEAGLMGRLFKVMLPAGRPDKPFIAPQRGYPGVSFGYFRFYVTNSEPSIKTQLSRCLRHYNTAVKGRAFLGGEPVNFVTGDLERGDHPAGGQHGTTLG
jgi:hypothetical protein